MYCKYEDLKHFSGIVSITDDLVNKMNCIVEFSNTVLHDCDDCDNDDE